MQQDSLQQLNDIVEPQNASWWPPAWPLIIIAAITLIALLLIAIGVWRHYRAKRPQRIALSYLNSLKRPSASDITLLCKQVALAYYSRQKIASLNGEQWLRFLGADQQPQFRALLQHSNELLYKPVDSELLEQYQQLADNWIRQAHKHAKRERRHV
ncbi:MAG: DUF4381 domain-containing protein [Pseudomonadota bacterium]